MPCGRRQCAYCGRLWLGDCRVKTVAAAERVEGELVLVTVTAPGADVLPWYPGTRSCEARAVRHWNLSAPGRWTQLHHDAAQYARRNSRSDVVSWRLAFKVWELQRRGALHLHLACPWGTPAERKATKRYVKHLQDHAREHSFGFVHLSVCRDEGTPTRVARARGSSARNVARYVCHYVGGTGAGKEGFAEVARKAAVPGAILYVDSRLTQASGVTIRSLRARRRIVSRYPWSVESSAHWRAACMVDGLQRGRAPLDAESVAALRDSLPSMPAVECVSAPDGELIRPTPAAPPRELPGGWDRSPCRPVRVAVLLDPVLHDDLTAKPGGPIRTHVRAADPLLDSWFRGPPL